MSVYPGGTPTYPNEGARKQASLIYDIADCTRFHGLPTGSDVFAIAQQDVRHVTLPVRWFSDVH